MTDPAAFTRLLLQKMTEPCTVEELLAEAALCGLPDISVCDSAYNLLASSHDPRNDNVFVPQNSGKYVMRPEIVAELQQKGISKRLQRSPHPFWFYNDALGQLELFCAVLYNGQVLGYLFQRPEQPPTEEQLACWDALAPSIAIVLQRSGAIEPDAGQQLQETVLLQLALGQISDLELAQARLAQSGWTASAAYRVGCLFTNEISLFSALRPKQLSAQLRNTLPGCICCCYQDHLILLGPGDLDQSPSKDTRIRLRHWLKYHHFKIAASAPFSEFSSAAAAYRQAQELVNAVRMLAGSEHPLPEILYYEDHLPVCAYLSAYGKETLFDHIHPHIVQLAAHDREHNTQYLATLSAYFASGRNMTNASKALFIHKTTLFYRFDRMEKLVGPFMNDQNLLFLYEYSLRLMNAFSAIENIDPRSN